jgi:hypothetical protein
MTLKRRQITVVLGFFVLIGIACSTGNKPLDPPFESLIPKCEYFAPLFDSAKATMFAPQKTGVLNEALRRCSGNKIELFIRLKEFADSAESSRYMEELKGGWTERGRRVSNRDYSYTTAGYNDDTPDPLDGYFEVGIGREAECLIKGGERFFYGSALLSYIQVGNFVGEYELEDCTEDKHLKDYWSDFGELATRLDTINPSPKNRATYGLPSFEEQLLDGIAIPETARRIRRLID